MSRSKKIKKMPITNLEGPHKQSIEALVEGLYYPSESDEPLAYVALGLPTPAPLNENHLRVVLGESPSTLVEEISLEEFFLPLTESQDWYDDDEKFRTEQFVALHAYLLANLLDTQVFRIGEVQVHIYVLGRTSLDNCWEGFKTISIET
jgi:hypothetical protein